jgi:hypothetical protein
LGESAVTQAEAKIVGKEIYDYIQDRAKVEGVAFYFHESKFVGWVELGVVKLFGVTYDKSGILADQQEPQVGYLERWKLARAATKS